MLRPDLSATITGEVLNQMPYARRVVREVLRFRPPAPMVPQVRRCARLIRHLLASVVMLHTMGRQTLVSTPSA